VVSFTLWDRGPGIFLTGGWARRIPKLEVLEKKHLFPLPVFESRIVQAAAYSLYRHPVTDILITWCVKWWHIALYKNT
jgi:hypothetical protein